MKARRPAFDWNRFFEGVSRSGSRALLLDYDGTLASFRTERDQAVPDPQLRRTLEGIVRAGRTRVVIISGRALRELIPLLSVEPLPELWGCHGWERLLPGGEYRGPELERPVKQALQRAQEWASSAGLNGRIESKPAGIAVHWRGVDPAMVERLEVRVRAAWEPLARQLALELSEFDGGLELHATGRDKGFAVATILAELTDDGIVAYAGDDRTDEDAFRALSGRGLSILVRPDYRETAAELWLEWPHEWARFLSAWLAADMEGG